MSELDFPRSSSRDIWSYGGGSQAADLLASVLSTLLLLGPQPRAAYFSSPWMSDFKLFDNRFGAYGSLFPERSDEPYIRFSDYLILLARLMPVRLITTRTDTSISFLGTPAFASSGVQHRFAKDEYHEKGILAPSFYIEGSMNITYSGVYIRGEKITYHTVTNAAGMEKIARAYLEFERRWDLLK